jgi:hypothetical protein
MSQLFSYLASIAVEAHSKRCEPESHGRSIFHPMLRCKWLTLKQPGGVKKKKKKKREGIGAWGVGMEQRGGERSSAANARLLKEVAGLGPTAF